MRPALALLPLVLALATARADNIVFPADAGVIDVTKAPYNAKADGTTDATAAIQKALDDHPSGNKIIYLPHGTYLITKTLTWPAGRPGATDHKRTILQGQSREGTILKLKDGTATDPKKPVALLWTGKKPAQRFRNAVRNLTLDAGDNRGAIGAQFNANNQGTFRDVLIKGNGVIGLDMAYSDEIGPLLVKNVTVEGFNIGIKTGHTVDSMTFEHINLNQQREAGLINNGQCVSIHGLTSRNLASHIVNGKNPSFMALVKAYLAPHVKAQTTGGAILNDGYLWARDVEASGYLRVVDTNGPQGIMPALSDGKAVNRSGFKVATFASHPVLRQFDNDASLDTLTFLPIQDTPHVPWANLNDWTSPLAHGGKRTTQKEKHDVTAAMQKAADSGKSTLYLPNGQWLIDGDVTIPATVRRIIGCEARIMGKGQFIIAEGKEPVIVERIDATYSSFRVAHEGKRTVVISSSIISYESKPGAGDLFLEDVCGAPWTFHKGQNVWARQLNPENEGTKITNDGANLWILGLKTERAGTLVHTKNGGRTEVVGGFCYTTAKKPHDAPMFLIEDAHAQITIGEACFTGQPFETIVRETRNGVTKDLKRTDVPRRANGSAIVLYVSGK